MPLTMLQDFLRDHDIPFDPITPHAGLRVRTDLNLGDTDIIELPDDMVVYGSLDLTGQEMVRLPDGLWVHNNLILDRTTLAALPECLCVGNNLSLHHSAIMALPDDLRVGGMLDLSHTRIEVLPKGLDVAGVLDLSHTRVLSLPEDLRVGGMIVPPNTLAEIPIYLARHGPLAVLVRPGSQHASLVFRQSLRETPDLCRVVQALDPGLALVIEDEGDGSFSVDICSTVSP